jgi:flagellar protein FliO/FliZ
VLELTIRLVASLAVVVGLLLVLARVTSRRLSGRQGALVQVLHRQPLSRSASVSVLSVGSRVLVVGTTDQQVQVLTELDPEELDAFALPALSEVPDAPVADGADDPDHPGHPAGITTPLAPVVPALPLRARSAARRAGAHRATPAPRATDPGALTGSVLSAQTWRQALAAATGKAS